MTFPSLPTDNLYKFLALAGVVIVILSVYFVEIRVAEVAERIIDVQEAHDITAARGQELKRKAGLFKKIIDDSIAAQLGKQKRDLSKFAIGYSEAEVKEMQRQMDDLIAEQAIVIIKTETSTRHLRRLHERSIKIFHWSIPIILFGIAMATVGFFLWYWLVQRPLDLLLLRARTLPMQSNPALSNDQGDKDTQGNS